MYIVHKPHTLCFCYSSPKGLRPMPKKSCDLSFSFKICLCSSAWALTYFFTELKVCPHILRTGSMFYFIFKKNFLLLKSKGDWEYFWLMLSNSSTVQFHIKVTKDWACSPVGQASRGSQQGSVMLCDPLTAVESTPHREGLVCSCSKFWEAPKGCCKPGSHIAIVLALHLTNWISEFGKWVHRADEVRAVASILWGQDALVGSTAHCSSYLHGLDQHPFWWTGIYVISDVEFCLLSFLEETTCPFSIWYLRYVQLRVIGIMEWWSQFFPIPSSVMEHW